MDLQYISDADGKHTAVVIPIDDWMDLTAKHQELLELERQSEKPKKMSAFKGILTEREASDLQAYVTKSRQEWSSDI